MYLCNHCKLKFDFPKLIDSEIFFGVFREFNYTYGNKVSVCPYCESTDFEEIIERGE